MALKALFHPAEAWKVGGWTIFQGVIPRKKAEIARGLAATICERLLTPETLQSLLTEQLPKLAAIKKQVRDGVRDFIDNWEITGGVLEGIANLGAFMFRDQIANWSAENLAPYIKKKVEAFIKHPDRLPSREALEGKLVDAVNLIPNREIEHTLFGFVQKELRFVEGMGALLGGVIGVVQFFLAKTL